jgi:hypothetical protein
MAARKEPTGWVQGIASPRSLFLRRKVASFRRETPILQKTLLAQQRFQGVSEPRLIFNGVAQANVVAGSGIECGRAP